MKEESKIARTEIELQFKENYELLLIASFSIVKDINTARDIVQDFFEYYINRKRSIAIRTSFQAYAVRAVKNMSYTFLKKMDREQSVLQKLCSEEETITYPSTDVAQNEYDIIKLLDRLPDKRKEIFKSSVLNGLSYSEIAEANGISVNTVKTQIKRAYAFLRASVNVP